MNSKTNYNIYQLSQQIQQERLKIYEEEAKQIANAYRKVEQLKVQKPATTSKPQKTQQSYKPSSSYAMKVKETIKEINSTKAKQCKGIIKPFPETNPRRSSQNREQQKLFNIALTRIYSIIESFSYNLAKSGWQRLVSYSAKDEEMENSFIIKFRKFRIFRAWKEQIILIKIQKQNNQGDLAPLKATQLAIQFRAFNLIKKSFSFWCLFTKRQIKRKLYQKELLRNELKPKVQQKKDVPKTMIKQNQELQSKVRNFVGKLKQQIENKDRLITIKENTEQSQLNIKIPYDQQDKKQEKQPTQQAISEQIHNMNQDEAEKEQQVVIYPPNHEENLRNNKQMNSQELQKKRKELELKHKSRKDALQKLKKEKQQKKKEQELLRRQLEKQIQAEQKRIKQQKYKEYVKNKKDQEEWEIKEKQLETRAQQFNSYRLKKYYGWMPLFNSKNVKKEKILLLYQTILGVVYRFKSQAFLNNLEQVSAQILQSKYLKMNQRYKQQLVRKAFSCFKSNKIAQLQFKEQLIVRHQVNHLKISFFAWRRTIPLLRDENVDWQLPRNKRADQFYRLQLFHKGIKALKQNKQLEQRDRIINEQKLKIKNKIKDMLEEEGELNYDQFL